jgi:hypothetical protein
LKVLGGKVTLLFYHPLSCTPRSLQTADVPCNLASLLFSHIQLELHLGTQEIPDGLTTSWIIKLLSIENRELFDGPWICQDLLHNTCPKKSPVIPSTSAISPERQLAGLFI